MGNLSKAIEDAIENLYAKIDESVDKKFLEELTPMMERLKAKQAEGRLDLRDFKDLLRIYRNVIIPAVKKQNVDRLRVIKDMIEATE